ncbi:AAA family ATPase [Actinoplanes sp. KI2]|uniref:AAA family ATPase n=1 Tax=Actinoplanes sp. KI2 TaxID=2983315 RepID=UPI0021D5F755|nr:AAA family ATPase [Actinoplanes sp. KI2]MCU7730050.1 AAA family ATPase [Actinoplanes sp. KI2]
MSDGYPAWLREVRTALSINSQIVLYGNVRDVFLLPAPHGWEPCDLQTGLHRVLAEEGYQHLVVADPVAGLGVLPADPVTAKAAAEVVQRDNRPPWGPWKDKEGPLGALCDVIERVATADGQRSAVLIEFASRLILDPGRLDPAEHAFFARSDRLSRVAYPKPVPTDSRPLYNPIVWAVNNERDLPVWLTAGNDDVRKIAVPLPEFGVRETAARWLANALTGYREAGEDDRHELERRLAEQTQGMTLRSMMAIARLAARMRTPIGEIDEAVRCYRVGVHDNPWRASHLRGRMQHAAENIASRVKGQREAVQRSVDILVRAVLGLSGAQAGGNVSRPRGVLFFAGPTGVGKTELAKELTQQIFGDARAYTRFDMSEFSAEHSADRLIGAPPGYVGHDAGGELTNAVRQRPFSLLLFDEVEKANPRILDKFLQILDDGRLTDASGSTVYFSETVLVFTSNLGVTAEEYAIQREADPLQAPFTRDELEVRVRRAVEHHFTTVLNRPELLNRLGDNIVVFNFIDAETAAEIFDVLVAHVHERLRAEHGVDLRLTEDVRRQLLAGATRNLAMGGRGIGSHLESALVNPLARELFRREDLNGRTVTVTDVREADGMHRVSLA